MDLTCESIEFMFFVEESYRKINDDGPYNVITLVARSRFKEKDGGS